MLSLVYLKTSRKVLEILVGKSRKLLEIVLMTHLENASPDWKKPW